MADVSFASFIPQTEDSERILLARLRPPCISGTALASAARTASTLSSNISTRGARGIIVYLNVTSASGTGGLTVRLFGVDPLTSSVALNSTMNPAVTTTGTRLYVFGPGCGAASSGSGAWGAIGTLLGNLSAIQILHGDSSSYTYSVSYELIP